VRLYTASSEDTLPIRKLLTPWAGEGFLAKAHAMIRLPAKSRISVGTRIGSLDEHRECSRR
jgi:hypothetical protein